MNCEWGYTDCVNLDKKCHLCFTADSINYVQAQVKRPAQMAKRQQKADGRMGSTFEFKNHMNNRNLIEDVSTRMTPNSGAGKIKGDEEIRGIINIMEELKTKVVKQAPGKETFTIKKEWLNKLNREASEVNKEFWYLKFCFNEFDDDIYCITEQEIIMSMVKTMIEDRRAASKVEKRADIAEKQRRLIEAENVALLAKIDLLESQLREREHLFEGAEERLQ